MTTTTTSELVPGYLDVTRLAVTSFLARYRERGEHLDGLYPGPEDLPGLVPGV